jgi:hypothetical protein
MMETGKRSAVRNNSGLPVDHSGPGLGVGPTTPPTAGRKPEACPPSSFSLSQRKSGQGSGDRVPGGGEAAVGSSLDPIQINRNITYENVFVSTSVGRNKNCGRFTLVGTSADGQKRRYIRVDCKCWDCRYCGPRKAKRYKRAIRELAEAKKLNRFLTLTLDPRSMDHEDPVAYINKVFGKWRTYLKRKFGVSITYIRVLEFQKNGNPHFHILVDRFIPQAWIKQSWQAVGGGKFVHIQFVDVHRISRYLSKYLTKEMLLSAPKRSRRVTVSRGLKLLEKSKASSDTAWRLIRISIWVLFDVLIPDLRTVEFDLEGVLKSFVTE